MAKTSRIQKRGVRMGVSMAVLLLLVISATCTYRTNLEMQLDGDWMFRTDPLNKGQEERWFLSGIPRIGWTAVKIPDFTNRYDTEERRGVAWYAKNFVLHTRSDSMSIVFNGVDNVAQVWLNGRMAGTVGGYCDAFALDATLGLKEGENEIVVRVADPNGRGGIYGPVSLVPSNRVNEALRTASAGRVARRSADWVRDAVIYSVYLRAFSNEASFKSLEERLPEIKNLGITVLWLLPIHPIGDANRKGTLGSPYAVRDYYAVNAEYGTMEDLRSLVAAVHRHGMKIILDLVINHTAWDSQLLFEYPEWFVTDESGAILSPTAEWTDVAGLNLNHHELRKYLIAMMEFWVKDVGVDGFRCDVAQRVPMDFWKIARTQLDRIKPVLMVAEGSLPQYHLDAFDVTYAWNTCEVLEKLLTGSAVPAVLHESLRLERLRYPEESLRLRFYTNHDKNAWDQPAVTKFGREASKLMAALVYTLPGIPLIYNGEEVGNTERLDLFEKASIDWTDRFRFRALFEELGSMRKNYEVFRRGKYEPVENSNAGRVLSFARVGDAEVAVIVANVSHDPVSVSVRMKRFSVKEWKVIYGGREQMIDGAESMKLPGYGWKIFIGTRTKG
jgi:glycosidase